MITLYAADGKYVGNSKVEDYKDCILSNCSKFDNECVEHR